MMGNGWAMGWTAILAAGLVAVSGLSAREVHGPGFELVVIDSLDKPDGPFWFVPHDNEAAAWRVGLEALQAHGGRLVAVENAGRRMWPAPCPVSCDPNRSLGANPYGDAVIRLMSPGQPVVGLHTNAPGRRGLGAGAGTTWADARDRNVWMPRALAGFADGDALAIVAGTRPKSDAAPPCLPNFMMGGAPMLYEEVRDGGDGSMSNDLALRQPERTYVALEARHGDDDSLRALLAILMACPAYAQP
ncbi:hypothetical protein [Phenylobacterium sp.]|uniref:hypothetical protein n=1 Tax=Phenylobacterium sp. TaxID=1871053 RepID=UPI0035B0A40A